MLNLFTVAYFT